MGFREDLKVNKTEKKPDKKMMEEMEEIEARKLREVPPSNEKMMKEKEARNCPEYDGDER